MIIVVNAENRSLFAADLIQMYRQRKTVFVDGAGWKVPAIGDQEIDCYDHQKTIYLLAKEDLEGPLLASVRLLPTTRPHLMGDLFSGACREAPPHGPTVWEVSRSCFTPDLPGHGVRLGLPWEVICGVIETTLLCGVKRVIFIANRGLLPLVLICCGWEAPVPHTPESIPSGEHGEQHENSLPARTPSEDRGCTPATDHCAKF